MYWEKKLSISFLIYYHGNVSNLSIISIWCVVFINYVAFKNCVFWYVVWISNWRLIIGYTELSVHIKFWPKFDINPSSDITDLTGKVKITNLKNQFFTWCTDPLNSFQPFWSPVRCTVTALKHTVQIYKFNFFFIFKQFHRL